MALSSILEETKNIFIENRRITSGQQFTAPSEGENQKSFESCLFALVLKHIDIKSAEREIISIFNHQKSNGKIVKEDGSEFTFPPIIAYSAFEVFKTSQNENFLEKIFPKLDKFYKWLSAVRDPYSQNLLSIIHPEESWYAKSLYWKQFKQKEIENAYTNLEYNDDSFLRKEYFDVKDVFFNSVYLESLKSMAEIAKIVNKDDFFYKRKYQYTKEAMQKLYSKNKNLFFSHGKESIEYLTPIIFTPLFAGLPTSSQASSLVNIYLVNKQHFWTEYPIPTVSFSEKAFDSTSFWNGSSFIPINWFVFKGLLKYNFIEAAEDLYTKTLDMVKQGFYEHYNSTTGLGLGKKYAGSCLILDMQKDIAKVL